MTEDRLAFYLLDPSPVLFLDIKMLFREQVEGRLETKLNKDIETRYVCVCRYLHMYTWLKWLYDISGIEVILCD